MTNEEIQNKVDEILNLTNTELEELLYRLFKNVCRYCLSKKGNTERCYCMNDD